MILEPREILYVTTGLIGVFFYGRTVIRRYLRLRTRRDRRSLRELVESMAFMFVSFQILALTVGGVVGISRVWLIVGAAVAVGAFAAAGVVYDQEDRNEP